MIKKHLHKVQTSPKESPTQKKAVSRTASGVSNASSEKSGGSGGGVENASGPPAPSALFPFPKGNSLVTAGTSGAFGSGTGQGLPRPVVPHGGGTPAQTPDLSRGFIAGTGAGTNSNPRVGTIAQIKSNFSNSSTSNASMTQFLKEANVPANIWQIPNNNSNSSAISSSTANNNNNLYSPFPGSATALMGSSAGG